MRYGVSVRKAESGPAWRDLARRYEDWGFDLLQVPDHVGWFDPFTAIAAATALLAAPSDTPRGRSATR